MKRIVSRQVWDRVPDTSVKPIADFHLYIKSQMPEGFIGTMFVDYATVEGGYVPMKTVGPRTEQVEEEYLSAGELRAVLSAVPDETPVLVPCESGDYSDADRASYDGKRLIIE